MLMNATKEALRRVAVALSLSTVLVRIASPQNVSLRILDAAARMKLRDREGRLQSIPAATTGQQLLAHPRVPDLGVIVKGEGTFNFSQGVPIEVVRD